VEGDLVVVLLVDSLDDVDLSIVGPVVTKGPKSGPSSADASGHVSKIGDQETVSKSSLGLESDRFSSRVACTVSSVDADVCFSIVRVDETTTLGGSSVYVLNVTVRRIASGEKVKLVKEVPAGPSLSVAVGALGVVVVVVSVATIGRDDTASSAVIVTDTGATALQPTAVTASIEGPGLAICAAETFGLTIIGVGGRGKSIAQITSDAVFSTFDGSILAVSVLVVVIVIIVVIAVSTAKLLLGENVVHTTILVVSVACVSAGLKKGGASSGRQRDDEGHTKYSTIHDRRLLWEERMTLP